MTLRLNDEREALAPIGDWAPRTRPVFMKGEIYKSLLRNIRRYLDEDIAGRSYLIAGHRGSGKTALTERAVADVKRLIIESSLVYEPGSRVKLQRPLLVKLHGPSLVDPAVFDPPAPPAGGDPAEPGEGEAKAEKGAGDAAGGGEAPAKPAGKDAKKPEAHAALVQITIGLYRSLAREFTTCYGAHVPFLRPADQGDGHELAAQLALELDAGADPALLRTYWDRLGRLEFGVLWPVGAEKFLRGLGRTDQGAREIVALSAAAQAYQVCAGAVTYKYTDKTVDQRKAEATAKGAWDMKDVVGRLGALGVGALTGAALWRDGAELTAVGAGSLVWLLGTASLSWTTTRKTERNRNADYTYLRDRTIQTLDRELPMVIQRVRDAGLAPIFVIDELDKLDQSADKIANMIKALKHIIADYGFFCFLTDRNYYDEVGRKVRLVAYPVEHTFFSERRLVAYTPKEFADYLLERIASDAEPAGSEDFDRTLFTYWLLQRARLNFADVIRELGSWVADDGVLEVQGQELRSSLRFSLAATVQLSVETALNKPLLAARVEDDPAFAQLAYDALYEVSRCWAAGKSHFDVSKLGELLLGRLNAGRDEKAQPLTIPPEDLELINEAVLDQLGLLSDFARLAREVGDRLASNKVRLAEMIPTSLDGGLLQQPDDTSSAYYFTHNAYGRQLSGAQPLNAQEIPHLRAMVAAFAEVLKTLQLTFEDLIKAGLLPPGLSETALAEARDLLESRPTMDDQGLDALARLRLFRNVLRDQGERLGAGLALCRRLIADTPSLNSGPARGAAISDVFARYPVLGPLSSAATWSFAAWAKDFADLPPLNPPNLRSQAGIENFAAALKKPLPNPGPGAVARVEDERWVRRLEAFFAKTPLGIEDFGYADLREAAAAAEPAAFLRADPAAMTIRDWSRLCLWGLIVPSRRWAVVAALRALGFESRLLRELTLPRSSLGSLKPEDRTLAARVAEGAKRGRKGLLFRAVEADLQAPDLAEYEGAPLLYIDQADSQMYGRELDRLQRFNLFESVVDEID